MTTRSDITQTAGRIARIVRDTIDQTPRWVHTAFEVAKQLSEALPDRNSTPLKATVQLVNCVQTVRSTIWPEHGDPVTRFAERNGLTKHRSAQFVQLFFASDVQRSFSVGHVRVSDYQTVITARGETCGELAFLQYDYCDSPEATFYLGKTANLEQVTEAIWNEYGGHIHVTLKHGENGSRVPQYARIAQCEPKWFGNAMGRLDDLVARHRRFVAARVPRAYMFYGPPGTGKSTFATTFADRLGERILKLDATSLGIASVRDIAYLLDGLRPHFVIIDDVDKADTREVLPTILEIVQRFKTEDVGTTAILTANAVKDFDAGLLRPGRIDTWLEFPLPNEDQRLEVLRAYCADMGASVSPLDMAGLVRRTDGLSHDYLRELSIVCRDGGATEGLAAAERMKTLLASGSPTPGAPIASTGAPSPMTKARP